MENIEQYIKESWFKNHRATLTKHGDLKILDWRNPEKVFYYCRYVFDGNRLYISGDMGDAVFCLTWKADIHSFNDIHQEYFHEKLSAFSGPEYDFDENKAINRLKEEIKEHELRGQELGLFNKLIEEIKGCCSTTDNWRYIVEENWKQISSYNQDIEEWIFDIGNIVPRRIQGYLIGLKMASEQLKQKKTV